MTRRTERVSFRLGQFQRRRRAIGGGATPFSPADIPSVTYWDFRINRTITSPPDIDSVAAASGSTAPTLDAGSIEPHAVSTGADFAASTADSLVSTAANSAFRPLIEDGGSLWVVASNESNGVTFVDNCRINTTRNGLYLEINNGGVLSGGLMNGSGADPFNVFRTGVGTSASLRLIEMHWGTSGAELWIDGVEEHSVAGPITLVAANPSDAFTVGLNANGVTNPLDGIFAGLALKFGAEATVQEKTDMRVYLASQHGVTLP